MQDLSKSDFKIASSCAKKLVYKKNKYKTKNDESEFMDMLAEGGFYVSKLAQLHYPEGIEIPSEKGKDFSIDETRRLIDENENIVLFEAAFRADQQFIRVDILEKKGRDINLIEVKAKSFDSADKEILNAPDFREYIEDVTFQYIVLEKELKGYAIHPYLLMPDKAKRTDIDGLAGWFTLKEGTVPGSDNEFLPAREDSSFELPVVEFLYENDPDREYYIRQLKNNSILTLIPLDQKVAELTVPLSTLAKKFINILKAGIIPGDFRINKECKACEFNLGVVMEKNGYRECWEDMADIDPHIFDLYYGGSLKTNKIFYYNTLIDSRKVSLFDIDPKVLYKKDGSLGSRGVRQLLQLQQGRNNQDFYVSGLRKLLDGLKYPLHFIDFETYRGPIPFHKNMRPYENIAFQWSCHTIDKPGASPSHQEWINEENRFPNFRFAEALMNHIGNGGTPLMWAKHENSVLREILDQMTVFNYKNSQLKKWLEDITSDGKMRPGRFIDMNELTLQYYFHPYMKGKTSIKKVLPAIWNNNPYLHSISYFKEYFAMDEKGIPKSPYDTLPPIDGFESDEEEVIKEGTAAMHGYAKMMFSPDAAEKKKMKLLLSQYCKLDTMAMVIIWHHWLQKCKV